MVRISMYHEQMPILFNEDFIMHTINAKLEDVYIDVKPLIPALDDLWNGTAPFKIGDLELMPNLVGLGEPLYGVYIMIFLNGQIRSLYKNKKGDFVFSDKYIQRDDFTPRIYKAGYVYDEGIQALYYDANNGVLIKPKSDMVYPNLQLVQIPADLEPKIIQKLITNQYNKNYILFTKENFPECSTLY